MMDTPIMAATAIPSAATATPVRLNDAAISPNASRAMGLARPAKLAAARARPRSTAGVIAATLNNSRNSAANPANRLRPETNTTMPAEAASTALTMMSLRAI